MAALCGLVAICEISASGIVYGPTNPIFPYIAVVPLVLTTPAAFRPWAGAAMGIAETVATIAAGSTLLHLSGFELEVRAAMCTVCGLVAAFGCQRQRKVWLQKSRANARSRLVAADRLTHMGRLSSALAHELKTPLATALNELGAVRDLVTGGSLEPAAPIRSSRGARFEWWLPNPDIAERAVREEASRSGMVESVPSTEFLEAAE